MDEPAQPALEHPTADEAVVIEPAGEDPAAVAARWTASLPPPPFVDPSALPGTGRFTPLSPRVAILIASAVVLGFVLAMAADSVRPFIIGLLFVYLLDPPVRWLVRLRVPRPLAILIVYVVFVVALVEFLALTLTPPDQRDRPVHRGPARP